MEDSLTPRHIRDRLNHASCFLCSREGFDQISDMYFDAMTSRLATRLNRVS